MFINKILPVATNRLVIVVPIYRKHLSDNEVYSIKNLLKYLGGYDICILCSDSVLQSKIMDCLNMNSYIVLLRKSTLNQSRSTII